MKMTTYSSFLVPIFKELRMPENQCESEEGGPHFSARNREGNAKNFKARGVEGVTDFADSDSGQSFLVIRNFSNLINGNTRTLMD